MKNPEKTDLRVVKTREAIRRVFEEMICEMDYDEITVKELTERALINRKTFYLHYETLDHLLRELQEEIAQEFIAQEVSYYSMQDIRDVIRFFFEYCASMPKLNERLLCSGSYTAIGDEINKLVMDHQAKLYSGAFSENPLIDRLVFRYFATNTPMLYRQWVADGKQLPLDDLIQTATTLICNGLEPFVKKQHK